MIQANEVRVGNRFIRELHTHNRGLDYDKDFVLDEDNMGLLFSDIRLALDDLFPIPITVEVLTELGFKNNGAMYSKPEDCVIDFELTYVSIYSEKHEDDIQYPLPKALHLLQNLYFFVTGKELNVQLSEPKVE